MQLPDSRRCSFFLCSELRRSRYLRSGRWSRRCLRRGLAVAASSWSHFHCHSLSGFTGLDERGLSCFPKKTWEGTLASFIGSLAVALAFALFMAVPLPHLLGMAAVGNVGGQVGDLLESAYKRSAGIKDSGSLLPGHGGVLDRIDALILAIPVVWYYWILIYSPKS